MITSSTHLKAGHRLRDIAKQREAVINQNGRPETVPGRLRWSAVWGATIWGTEDREFKSPQPAKQCAGKPVFFERIVWPFVALGGLSGA
jgi:hypothetical protein